MDERMLEYEFTFVLDGISLDDHTAVQRLTEELDALLSHSHGTPRMTVAGEGPDAVTAALAVVTRALDLVPTMRVVRLDWDLVGVSDIAERTGRSRQNVTQWVRGQRHDRVPFPAPEGTAGHSLIWLWSEVNTWLCELGLDDGENRPTRVQMAEIDWRLHGLRRTPLTLDIGPDRGNVTRVAKQLVALAGSDTRFIDYLRAHPQMRGSHGQYTIVVCCPQDRAVDAFRRLSAYSHPVVLAVATDTGTIHTLIMAPGYDNAAENCELTPDMTVADWFGLMRLSPNREFTVTAGGLTTIAVRSPLELTPT
ncbi:helix-turn-helix transcriptional regulator [Salinactinospora qingdaonensis]|uniref:Transcriptional regulator n=1 Tax=Salinactinospora qingdaonensis TaxID=702744 RepID=A0ABP7FRI9_9ACTN